MARQEGSKIISVRRTGVAPTPGATLDKLHDADKALEKAISLAQGAADVVAGYQAALLANGPTVVATDGTLYDVMRRQPLLHPVTGQPIRADGGKAK